MRQFDGLLRQGLMAANLEQYGPAIQRAQAESPDFSPGYLRERTRLLADPQGWARRRRNRKLYGRRRRLLRSAACVLLVCTLALGCLMAASPTVRADVFGWLRTIVRTWNDNSAYYEGPSGNVRIYEEPPTWRPAWIPESFRFTGVSVSGGTVPDRPGAAPGGGGQYRLSYGEFHASSPGSRYFVFICHHSRAAHIGIGSMEGVRIQTATVWGRKADLYTEENNANQLIWTGPGGELFQLMGRGLDPEDLVRIAESVQEMDVTPLPEYRPGWLPEGASVDDACTSVMAESAQLTFLTKDLCKNQILYAAESMGPLPTPEGTPETAEINGIPGQFYAALEQDDGVSGANGSGRQGVTSRTVSSDQMHTLMWTDPKTGISFRLQATSLLSKEDLLRIAENLEESGGQAEP